MVDPSLIPKPVTVSSKENGWVLFQRALDKYNDQSLPDDLYKYPSIREDAESKLKSLESVRRALDLLVEASDKPHWSIPARVPGDQSLPSDDAVKGIVGSLAARGQALIYLGKSAEGARDLVAVRRIGLALISANGIVNDAILGTRSIAVAERSIEQCCLDANTSDQAIRTLLAEIPATPDVDLGMQGTLKSEMVSYLVPTFAKMPDPVFENENFKKWTTPPENDYFDVMTYDNAMVLLGKDMDQPFDRADCVRSASEGYAVAVRNLALPWSKQLDVKPVIDRLLKGWPSRVFAPDEWSADDREKGRRALQTVPNAIGRMIVGSDLEILPQYVGWSFRWRTRQEVTRTVLAIRLWKSRHGNMLPRTLNHLVSAGLLKRLPRDFFADGKPLHYDPVRSIIWSVGTNGVDDGGNDPPESLRRTEDYVWSATGD